MSKSDPIEQALEKLTGLRALDNPALIGDKLSPFFVNRSNLVVAKAANIVRENRLAQLVPELITAFRRFMADSPRLDKRCAAATQIAMALYELDYCEPDIYLQGIRHVQLEASFGPPVDVAAELRGVCAQGLVRTRYRHALREVVQVLADDWTPARIGAVKALATNGGEAGVLTLRLKALTGDADAEVMAECFIALLAAERDDAIDFVAHFVESRSGELQDAAILALGSSGLSRAITFLRDKFEASVAGAARKTLLLALATSRQEDAMDYLLGLLEHAPPRTAADVISALAIHKVSDRVRGAVNQAVDRRREPELLNTFRREFTE